MTTIGSRCEHFDPHQLFPVSQPGLEDHHLPQRGRLQATTCSGSSLATKNASPLVAIPTDSSSEPKARSMESPSRNRAICTGMGMTKPAARV